ncbi:OCRE domain-containing protein [Micropruina sp.]|uniref:OCRE domain-containing protein n=1 Tax=Micropruina sp. TaxID=2737536 RepID=UPI0039E2B394
MPASAQILIETTRTHRRRLGSALAFGSLEERRVANNNVKRAIGSIVTAAVIGAVCVGTSFVTDLLARQREEQAITAFRSALASNPLKPGGDWVQDDGTGFLRNRRTGVLVDPQTGYVVDSRSGLSKDPEGRLIDPRIDWYIDPQTGYYTDPATGLTIDPKTQQIVRTR